MVARLTDRQMNNPSLKHQIEFDWLDDVFKKNK
jgi:hypothetical protein